MSKIICDICGTSYPETAKQCPICGSVRPGDAQRVTNEVKSNGQGSTGYTHVKGGHFSKSNVKKRTKASVSSGNNGKTSSQKNHKDDDSKSNRGLVVIAIILLLAIIGVVAYIAIQFFAPYTDPNPTNPTENLGGDIDLTCRDITLDTYTVQFELVGEAKLLDVKTTPEKPSETLTFRSENEEIATVTDKGKITAVGQGTTKIFITCGEITKECVVTVLGGGSSDATTPDSTPETTDPTNPSKPVEELRLNRKDFTLSYKGESWVLYNGSIAKNLITWSSDDESVATFIDGKAVAVGSGMTTIYAEYEGQKVSCIVRCSFKDDSGVEGNGGVSEDGGGSSSAEGVITGTVNVQDFLRIRSGPGTNYEVVGTLTANENVTITETKEAEGMTWGKISSGWISMSYVTVG